MFWRFSQNIQNNWTEINAYWKNFDFSYTIVSSGQKLITLFICCIRGKNMDIRTEQDALLASQSYGSPVNGEGIQDVLMGVYRHQQQYEILHKEYQSLYRELELKTSMLEGFHQKEGLMRTKIDELQNKLSLLSDEGASERKEKQNLINKLQEDKKNLEFKLRELYKKFVEKNNEKNELTIRLENINGMLEQEKNSKISLLEKIDKMKQELNEKEQKIQKFSGSYQDWRNKVIIEKQNQNKTLLKMKQEIDVLYITILHTLSYHSNC